VRREAKRHNWLAAGRRWRKTTLAMAIAVEEAFAGGIVVWGAPVYDQVRICWGETQRAARGVAEFRVGTMTAFFPGGGQIIYRSLDHADNVRGFTATGVVIDEAGDVTQSAWYEVLRPMLIDTGGWSWAIGTPKGLNYFWREHTAAKERPDSASWSTPTLGVAIGEHGLVRAPHPLENPSISFEEIEQLFQTTPERIFQQEVLSAFLEDGGSVFRNVSACVVPGQTENQAAAACCCLGVDLARIEDFTVLTVLDAAGRQLYFDRFREVSWERQIEAIIRTARKYAATVVMDSTGVGDPPFEAVRKAGVSVQGYQFTHASKERLIDALAMGLEHGDLKLMDIPQQTAELLAYQYELTPSRNVRMNAPAGFHDDTVVALALAWWGARRPAAARPQAGGQRAAAAYPIASGNGAAGRAQKVSDVLGRLR